jgi:sulfate/thiosulfate transport system substrate-binding protein
MQRTLRLVSLLTLIALALAACSGSESRRGDGVTLLNVSYDPTRELYHEINPAFAKHWLDTTRPGGDDPHVARRRRQAGPGGHRRPPGRRRHPRARLRHRPDARAANLDPRRLAVAPAPQQLSLHLDDRLPRARGEPEVDPDWGDLAKAGVAGDHAQPEDLGGRALELPGRLGLGLAQELGGVEALDPRGRRCQRQHVRPRAFVTRIYRNVPVLDSGARGSTNTFVQNGIGDVLLAWENEALLAIRELGADKFDIVVPSVSILAEPPVTVVDVVDRRSTARARSRRPISSTSTPRRVRRSRRSTTTARRTRRSPRDIRPLFPSVGLFTDRRGVRRLAAGAGIHFADGGVFDQIYTRGPEAALGAAAWR